MQRSKDQVPISCWQDLVNSEGIRSDGKGGWLMLMYRNKRLIIQSIRSYYNDDGYIRILLLPTSSLPYILVVCLDFRCGFSCIKVWARIALRCLTIKLKAKEKYARVSSAADILPKKKKYFDNWTVSFLTQEDVTLRCYTPSHQHTSMRWYITTNTTTHNIHNSTWLLLVYSSRDFLQISLRMSSKRILVRSKKLQMQSWSRTEELVTLDTKHRKRLQKQSNTSTNRLYECQK